MVDHNNHAAGLGNRFNILSRPCVMQKLSQTRNFFDAEVMGVRLLEERSLRAHDKDEFITSVCLHFTQVLNEFNYIAPT
jgi:hypothetical protein